VQYRMTECLNGEIFYSLKEAQILIERWGMEYTALGAGLQAACAGGGLSPSRQFSFTTQSCDVDSHSAWYKRSVTSPRAARIESSQSEH